MKKEIQKQMKGNRGITLIALVVTIVVLLILAGITISTLFGDNGIISAARKAADDTAKDQTNTEQGLQNLEDKMNNQLGIDTSSLTKLITKNSFITVEEGNQVVSDKTGKTMIVPVGFKITNDANEIDNGVVIEDKEHNQYVWVPVSDTEFNEMFGSTGSGNNINYFGKLYNFTATDKGSPMQSAIGSTSGNREPDITNCDGNNATYYSDLFTSAIGNITADDFKSDLQISFNEMAKSVKEYKGFYVGRYEASSLNTTNPKTIKGADPNVSQNMSSINWYNMYKNMQGVEKYSNSGVQTDVVTNMIWGCQWDRTLDWIATTDIKIGYAGLKDSRTWGNHIDSETFTYTKADGTTGTKVKNTSTPIPTGSTERNKANNIYDLAGNLLEWTMEACNTGYRILRGSVYDCSGSSLPVSYRFSGGSYYPNYSYINIGSRPTLYVKVP